MKWYQLTWDGNDHGDPKHTREDAEAYAAECAERYPDAAAEHPFLIEVTERPSALYRTTAPDDYDGFGTRTTERHDDGSRTVDILDEHATWQTLRYSSGMHGVTLI